MTMNDLLDAVCNGLSDNKTSQKLGISRQTFSAYRNGRKNPCDSVLEKFIEYSDLDPVIVYATAYADKIKNPYVAKAFREFHGNAA